MVVISPDLTDELRRRLLSADAALTDEFRHRFLSADAALGRENGAFLHSTAPSPPRLILISSPDLTDEFRRLFLSADAALGSENGAFLHSTAPSPPRLILISSPDLTDEVRRLFLSADAALGSENGAFLHSTAPSPPRLILISSPDLTHLTEFGRRFLSSRTQSTGASLGSGVFLPSAAVLARLPSPPRLIVIISSDLNVLTEFRRRLLSARTLSNRAVFNSDGVFLHSPAVLARFLSPPRLIVVISPNPTNLNVFRRRAIAVAYIGDISFEVADLVRAACRFCFKSGVEIYFSDPDRREKNLNYDEGDLDHPMLRGATVCLLTDPSKHEQILGVRDQGKTNCCYTFVAIDLIYALDYSSNGYAVKGSEQDLIDFVHHKYPALLEDGKPYPVSEEGTPNCIGNAFKFVRNYGIQSSTDCPFLNKCQVTKKFADRPQVENRKRYRTLKLLQTDNIEQTIELRTLGRTPAACGVWSTPSFQIWKPTDGIYMGPTDAEKQLMQEAKDQNKEDPYPRHVLLAVGQGQNEGVPYVILKNSWGTEWGYKGLIWVFSEVLKDFGLKFAGYE